MLFAPAAGTSDHSLYQLNVTASLNPIELAIFPQQCLQTAQLFDRNIDGNDPELMQFGDLFHLGMSDNNCRRLVVTQNKINVFT